MEHILNPLNQYHMCQLQDWVERCLATKGNHLKFQAQRRASNEWSDYIVDEEEIAQGFFPDDQYIYRRLEIVPSAAPKLPGEVTRIKATFKVHKHYIYNLDAKIEKLEQMRGGMT